MSFFSRTSRSRGLALIVPLTLAAAVLPASAQESGRPKTEVTQLLSVGIHLAQIREFVAKGLGFYADEGLDVRLQPALGSATQIRYMTAGQGTLGSIDMHMAVQQRKAPNGVKLIAVFSHLKTGVYRIATLEKNPIRRPEDFRGKNIGVPSQASGSYTYLLAAAQLGGVAKSDMSVIPVGFGPSSADALLRGRIDAIATVFPAIDNLRYLSNHDDEDWTLRDIPVPMDAWPTNAKLITEEDARTRRDVIIGMLRAAAKALVFIKENPLAALKVTQKLYPELVRDSDIPRQLQLVKWMIERVYAPAKYDDKPIGHFDMEAWAGTERYYKKMGLIGPDDSLADIIDTSFIAPANDFDKEKIRAMARDYDAK